MSDGGLAAVVRIRDDAATLERWLEHVAPHVDAIVVIDAGSVDDGPELLRGSRFAHLRWIEAGAGDGLRGGVPPISQSFVLRLDVDELLPEDFIASLRARAEALPPNLDGLRVRCHEAERVASSMVEVRRHMARFPDGFQDLGMDRDLVVRTGCWRGMPAEALPRERVLECPQPLLRVLVPWHRERDPTWCALRALRHRDDGAASARDHAVLAEVDAAGLAALRAEMRRTLPGLPVETEWWALRARLRRRSSGPRDNPADEALTRELVALLAEEPLWRRSGMVWAERLRDDGRARLAEACRTLNWLQLRDGDRIWEGGAWRQLLALRGDRIPARVLVVGEGSEADAALVAFREAWSHAELVRLVAPGGAAGPMPGVHVIEGDPLRFADGCFDWTLDLLCLSDGTLAARHFEAFRPRLADDAVVILPAPAAGMLPKGRLARLGSHVAWASAAGPEVGRRLAQDDPLEDLERRLTASVEEAPREAVHAMLEGRYVPANLHWLVGETMVGRMRLRSLRRCVETALREAVPGDLVETGVWRGGASILMRALLAEAGDSSRRVWVCDSFAGLPQPDPDRYPADAGLHFESFEVLAVSEDAVRAAFARYGQLDERVRFLRGWFRDTLPQAPIDRIAVLRLDGDLYESTMDALRALYHKVSAGGFVVVDDYGAIEACRRAVHDFREANAIDAPIERVDYTGAFWRVL